MEINVSALQLLREANAEAKRFPCCCTCVEL
jgi:hypothetical protein